MVLQIAGTNMEISPETQRYVERKLAKLDRHKPGIIDVKVEISRESTKSPDSQYLVRVTVQSGGGSGALLHGEERAESVFPAVDRVVDVLTRQLERRKGKLYDKKRGNSLARGKYVEPGPSPAVEKVVKRKRFAVEPVTLSDAIEQMETLGHNFFLFVDAANGEPRLLYRRKDGDYGLIEPEFRQEPD
jgi:putative sigma-54 modulation protein